MRGWMQFLVGASVALAAAGAQEARFEPEATTVALLPVANVSGEKDLKQRARQTENGERELAKLFRERGFKLVDADAIRRAISGRKLDLTDEEEHRRSTFLEIGKEVEADLVAFVSITDVSQRLSKNPFSETREGKARMRVWLLDVKQDAPILSGKAIEGKSSGGHFGALEKGSERIVLAVANGIRDQLKEFLKPYPVLKERIGKLRAP